MFDADIHLWLVAGRTLERLLVVIAGALAIYLGYRLFETAYESVGEIEAQSEGRWRLQMKRIAPGVFFALFGAGALVMSVITQIELRDLSVSGAAGATAGASVRYGLGSAFDGGDSELITNTVHAINRVEQLEHKRDNMSLTEDDRRALALAHAVLFRLRAELIDVLEDEGAHEQWLALSETPAPERARVVATLEESDRERYQRVDDLMHRVDEGAER